MNSGWRYNPLSLEGKGGLLAKPAEGAWVINHLSLMTNLFTISHQPQATSHQL